MSAHRQRARPVVSSSVKAAVDGRGSKTGPPRWRSTGHLEVLMTTVDDKPLTEEQVRELVIRAGMLLRFRPVPGSDPN